MRVSDGGGPLELPLLTGMSERVVDQYLALLDEYGLRAAATAEAKRASG